MNLNLLDVILNAAMGAVDFQYERMTETVDGYGRAVIQTVTRTGKGNFQPAPGEELDRLAEGDRGREAFLLFTPAALLAGPQGSNGKEVRADRVFYRGKAYRVSLSEPWQEHGGFTKAVLVYEGDHA